MCKKILTCISPFVSYNFPKNNLQSVQQRPILFPGLRLKEYGSDLTGGVALVAGSQLYKYIILSELTYLYTLLWVAIKKKFGRITKKHHEKKLLLKLFFPQSIIIHILL